MKPTSLYVIAPHDRSVLKVGMSADVARRLAQIQASSATPLSVIATRSGDRADEAAIHRQLREHRMHGEWFHDTPVVRATLRAAGFSFTSHVSLVFKHECVALGL